MSRSVVRTGVVAWSLLACSGASEPTWLLEAGDPCNTSYSFCLDDNSLLRCEERIWTQLPCSEFCSEQGPSWVAAGCDDGCQCGLVEPEGCTPGETSCAGPDAIQTCSDEQTQVEMDCETVCTELELESLGCREGDQAQAGACWCTLEGTRCESDEPRCVDAVRIARCIVDTWTFDDCSLDCEGIGECDPFTAPPACRCSE